MDEGGVGPTKNYGVDVVQVQRQQSSLKDLEVGLLASDNVHVSLLGFVKVGCGKRLSLVGGGWIMVGKVEDGREKKHIVEVLGASVEVLKVYESCIQSETFIFDASEGRKSCSNSSVDILATDHHHIVIMYAPQRSEKSHGTVEVRSYCVAAVDRDSSSRATDIEAG